MRTSADAADDLEFGSFDDDDGSDRPEERKRQDIVLEICGPEEQEEEGQETEYPDLPQRAQAEPAPAQDAERKCGDEQRRQSHSRRRVRSAVCVPERGGGGGAGIAVGEEYRLFAENCSADLARLSRLIAADISDAAHADCAPALAEAVKMSIALQTEAAEITGDREFEVVNVRGGTDREAWTAASGRHSSYARYPNKSSVARLLASAHFKTRAEPLHEGTRHVATTASAEWAWLPATHAIVAQVPQQQ